ncbi:MAG: hypothetical protein HY611_05045 [Elusimicrobia bacterium]|nr:hypothetical protein [Elusimicrobiota bacterium]
MKILLAFLLFILAPLPARGEKPSGAPVGRVQGHVFVSKLKSKKAQVPMRGWDFSGVVVYLAADGGELGVIVPPEHAVIRQKGAKFAPAFVAITAGQTVDFPNDDKIDHNVFSFSRTKKFDLGIYPKGRSKSVTFDQAGPVFIFCSVHESMNGIIFVSPTHLKTITNVQGAFVISGVPVGKYKVRTWHSSLPEGVEYIEVRTVDVQSAEPIKVDINLAEIPKTLEPG